MSEPVVEVRNVSKRFRVAQDRSTTLKYRAVHWRSAGRYQDFYALRDVSFSIPRGQFVGIVGENGCGKSTLLKILSRIYRPTTGQAIVRGRVSPFLELGVGFNPELTARENIYLNGAVLGLTRAQLTAKRVNEIIAFAGPQVQDRADDKIKNFSSGMQVRLAFSVAIQADADLLLMDEVLAVGDAAFQDKCFDVFARYRREGRTVVLVTHDLGSVDTYCDRAILIDNGSVLADGLAGEVTSLYRRRVGQHTDVEEVITEEEDSTRWGSGELSIEEVSLVDDAGHLHSTFTTGAPMTIRVRYRGHRDVGELTCGLAWHRADGMTVAGNNTFISGLRLRCPAVGAVGEVRYRVPALSLLRGTYRLTVALHDRHTSYPYDHHEQAYEFRVVDESFRVGVVDLGGAFDSDSVLERGEPLREGDSRALQGAPSPPDAPRGDPQPHIDATTTIIGDTTSAPGR